jgi:long-chain acyl-CoA synthetase
MNFYQIFKQTCSRYPERQAIFHRQQKLTYKDLDQLVEQLSGQLENLGIVKGRSVALLLQNTIGFAACFLAMCKCRAISVLFDDGLTSKEMQTIIAESRCAVFLTHQDRCSQILNELKVKASSTSIDFIEGEGLSSISLSESPFVSGNELQKSFDDIAVLQFTSGTTGTPKCVVRSHENIIHTAVNFVSTVEYKNTDRIVCTTPLHHAYALNTCLLSSIYAGAFLILPNTFNPIEILRIIEEQNASILVSIPYLYRLLTEFRLNTPQSIASIRLCISGGGSALSPKIANSFSNRFHSLPIQIYGSTESAEITLHRYNANSERLSEGIPFKNVELKIIGANSQDLAVNKTGEIAVRSRAVSPGYTNHIENSPFNNGWFHTGDIGFIDKNNKLNIIGRIRPTICISGKKVDPREVEKVFNAHPNVEKTVIIGKKDPICGEILKAVVILNKACSRIELIQFCKKRLSPFKIPQIIEFTDNLPLSATGKVQHKKLINLTSI